MDAAGAGIRTMDALCRNVSGRYVLRHRVHESRGIRRATKALSFRQRLFSCPPSSETSGGVDREAR